MNLSDLLVRAGDVIKARTWDAMAAAVQSLRLIKGPGVMLRSTPAGTVISFDPPPISWMHDFKVTLTSQKGATIRPGMVSGKPATINGEPLDPADGSQPPTLQWGATPQLDDNGYGWIAVEVQLGDKWEVTSAYIVQVADLDTDDGAAANNTASGAPVGYAAGGTLTLSGRRARHPLAMLRQRKNGVIVAFQVTRFDLSHRVSLASPTSTVGRHFFFPAA